MDHHEADGPAERVADTVREVVDHGAGIFRTLAELTSPSAICVVPRRMPVCSDFMHDCGLWTDPLFLPEGHEVKGARLISETTEVQRIAPALAKIVLFHSDIIRLWAKRSMHAFWRSINRNTNGAIDDHATG